MAHSRPLPIASVRHLLLGLLAIGLMLRAGGTCEAMAATLAPSVQHAACAEMPTDHQKPVKAASVDCTLCAALPGTAASPSGSTTFVAMQPAPGAANQLTGFSGGPAPPPPRVA